MTGTIARLTDKRFGFISQGGGQKDLFFHASAVVNTTWEDLQEGDSVTFDVGSSDKGPCAINVERA